MVTKVCESGPVFKFDNEGDNLLPSELVLDQNYPNPFNPTTSISFGLPRSSGVTLNIYNIAGQKVATLASGYYPAGNHVVTWDASSHSSGVYFYRLTTDEAVETMRMILLK